MADVAGPGPTLPIAASASFATVPLIAMFEYTMMVPQPDLTHVHEAPATTRPTSGQVFPRGNS